MRRKIRFLVAAAVVGGMIAAEASEAQQVFIHGFATQAYGQSTDYAQKGMNVDGTGDLRAAALQARVAFFSTGTQFVVQGSHRRVGGSPIAPLIDNVELDWAFAQQRVGAFSARVGRVPIPRGLVNEIRDVGTLLPFYQASKVFYTDGIETVDGGTLSFSKSIGGFDVEAQGFYGEVPIVIAVTSADGMAAIDAEGNGTWGGQLSLGLPIPGAKVIAGTLDSDVASGPNTMDWEYTWVGGEYQGDGYYARAERSWSLVPGWQKMKSSYVQAGIKVFDRVWLNGQHERGWAEIQAEPIVGYTYDSNRDWGVGLSYAFSTGFVVKAEQHWYEGYNLDQVVSIMAPAAKNQYFLISVSTAF